MKKKSWLLVVVLVVSSRYAEAQVTNLVVNGSTTSFTMTSGDAINWTYDCPVGALVNGEVWFDVNNNGVIEPATDVPRFIFIQTDGDTNGNGGPPDIDGTVDGHQAFYQPVGIAPGDYILRFTHNATSQQVRGTVLALSSPAHTISGHVSPPPGKSAQYINVEVHRNDQYGQPNSWDAFTDVGGNYAIQMNADTVGNPWKIRIENNPYLPSTISPSEIEITITGNHGGNDFTFIQAGAQVTGYVLDENDQPIPGIGVEIEQDSTSVYYFGSTDVSGFFQIGIPTPDLGVHTWELYASDGSDVTTTVLTPRLYLPVINISDSLFGILRAYSVNAQIEGTVRVNGNPPPYPVKVIAASVDSGLARTWSDSITGDFVIPVSDKIHNYFFEVDAIPFDWMVEMTVGHPGDTGIVVNIVTQTNVLINWADSWNMLSVPVMVSDNQKTSLFPQAISSAFSYSATGYQSQDFLFNGFGYWMKFSGSNSASTNGTYIAQQIIPVSTGWNLIGSITDSVPANTIEASGTTILTNPFGYSSTGYYVATSIQPGNAYWIKVTQDGQLVLKQTPAMSASRVEAETRNAVPPRQYHEGFNQLIVRDASSNVRTLFFTSRADLNLDNYELPPPPPAGIMDVRFGSNRMMEAPMRDIEKAISLLVSSAEYPLTISWKIKEKSSLAKLLISGKEVSLDKDDVTNIAHPTSQIELRLQSQNNDLPTEFVLDQNYPNPFNPNTVIRYQIPQVGAIHKEPVQLNVYNLLGQMVATLVDEVQEAGYKSVEWNASNYPSGIYYYRLVVGEFNSTKKLLIMK